MEIDDVITYGLRLLKEYGLDDWQIKLGSGKKLLGSCSYQKKLIKISKFHIMHSPKEQILDTIKHEVAHAIVGPGKGHAKEWKEMAVKVGAKPEKYQTVRHIPHRYELVCGVCNKVCRLYDRAPRRNIAHLIHKSCGRSSLGRLELRRL